MFGLALFTEYFVWNAMTFIHNNRDALILKF